jgi:hypothetical protein
MVDTEIRGSGLESFADIARLARGCRENRNSELLQYRQQLFGFLQICRTEAFGEPVVDGRQ